METKTLIIYQSGKQHTQKIAKVIAAELKCEALDINTITDTNKPNLEQYDIVGIGSGIYA
jgi:menaquinone-dependent protoporphyrinogen IX oxidase